MHFDYIKSIFVIVNQIIKAQMKTSAHLFAIALAFALIGCQEPGNSPNLIDTDWVLQSIETSIEPDIILDPIGTYSFRFEPTDSLGNNFVSGFFDCNSYTATFDISNDNEIDFDMLRVTEIYCGEVPEYEHYIDFTDIYSYEFQRDNLRLINQFDDYVLILLAYDE